MKNSSLKRVQTFMLLCLFVSCLAVFLVEHWLYPLRFHFRRSYDERKAIPLMHELFKCRHIPSNVSLPFPWFCHDQPVNLTLVGPRGSIPLEQLGQVQGNGPHLYHFNISPIDVGEVTVLHNGQVVRSFLAKSEECKCPVPIEEFHRLYGCSEEEMDRVSDYFKWWYPGTVTEELFEFTASFAYSGVSRVSIIGNEVYAIDLDTGRMWSGHIWKQVTELLRSVVRKVHLPDIEFLIHNHDFSFLTIANMGAHVIGFCSHDMNRDILIPSIDLIQSSFHGSSLRLIAEGRPWESRKAKAYFRGSNHGWYHVDTAVKFLFHNRFRAAIIAKDHPDLMDVKIVLGRTVHMTEQMANLAVEKGFACRNCRENSSRILDYKYLLLLDGFTAPFRTSKYLASGSLILKTASPNEEYFYAAMKAGKHYLQVREDLSDLVETIEWAKQNDDRAREIAMEGFKFFTSNLQQEDVLCWTATVLHNIKDGLGFEPKVRKGMQKIETNSADGCHC